MLLTYPDLSVSTFRSTAGEKAKTGTTMFQQYSYFHIDKSQENRKHWVKSVFKILKEYVIQLFLLPFHTSEEYKKYAGNDWSSKRNNNLSLNVFETFNDKLCT